MDQEELTDVNPTYALVRYMDGRESTVSLRDLSPCPSIPEKNDPPEGLLVSGNVKDQGSTSTPTLPYSDFKEEE